MRYWLLVPCLALLLGGCGSGTICFGGSDCGDDDDDERTVTVEGNLDSVTPPNAVRDLVVFVYSGLNDADLADGPPFDDFKYADAKVISEDDTFELTRIARGNLTVVVLLDDPEPDGTIDAGDECSVLVDGGDLSDVDGGRRVTIEDIDVSFVADDPADVPDEGTPLCPGRIALAAGCGCSTAEDIVISRDEPDGGGTSNNDGN